MDMAGFGVGTSNQTFVVKQELRVPLTTSVIFYKSLPCVFVFFRNSGYKYSYTRINYQRKHFIVWFKQYELYSHTTCTCNFSVSGVRTIIGIHTSDYRYGHSLIDTCQVTVSPWFMTTSTYNFTCLQGVNSLKGDKISHFWTLYGANVLHHFHL